MKKIYLYIGLILAASVGFCSCNDDETPVYPKENDELVEVSEDNGGNGGITVSSEKLDIIKEQSKTLEISEGAGEYRVSVLDNTIAEASIADNIVSVKGLIQGKTEILLSDKNGNFKNVKIDVYLTDNIRVNKEIMSMALFMGNPSTDSFMIEEGNGGYVVNSSNDVIVEANVNPANPNEVIVVAKGEGEAEITVTDSRGLSTKVKVTITNSDSPFSPEQLEEIKANAEIRYVAGTENYMDFITKKQYHNGSSKTYSTNWVTFFCAIGVNESGNYKNICAVRFDDKDSVPLNIGKIDGGTLYLRKSSVYSVQGEPCTFEIIKKEGGKVWAIFFTESISGHMVFSE